MLLNSDEVDPKKPLLGLAVCDDNINIKVSARAVRDYSNEKLNLSGVIRDSAAKVGGVGGGHNIAAGAIIPLGTEKKFIEICNKNI